MSFDYEYYDDDETNRNLFGSDDEEDNFEEMTSPPDE